MKTNNSPQQSSSQSNRLLTNKPKNTPRSLHRYILILVGLWGMFLVSFPLACARVARSEKFDDQPLKSISWSENQKDHLAYPEKE